MKPTVLALGLLLSVVSHAQVKKGTLQIGPSASYNRSEYESGTSSSEHSSTKLDLSLGYAFSTNNVFGVTGGLSQSKSGVKQTIPNLGAFYRRYFPVSPKGMILLQPEVEYAWFDDASLDYEALRIAVVPGFAYTVKPWLQLEASLPNFLSYQTTSRTNKQVADARHYSSKSFNIVAGQRFFDNPVRLGVLFNIN